MKDYESIFARYYSGEHFIDRFEEDQTGAIDVIIPVIHTSELWRANLKSFYREIPISRLLISDGGCIDDSMEVAREFPRVVVLDHRDYVSLGYCLRKLIEEVETDWFAYLHSDVYLPAGWFEKMCNHRGDYDWISSPQQMTVLAEYPGESPPDRALSGAQMGQTEVFIKRIGLIDDDYVYRQEEWVLNRVVDESRGRRGQIDDTFHYHQHIHKNGLWARTLTSVSLNYDISIEEQKRASVMQVKGLIKYFDPPPGKWRFAWQGWRGLQSNLDTALDLGALELSELRKWVKKDHPAWLPYIRKDKLIIWRLADIAKRFYRLFS